MPKCLRLEKIWKLEKCVEEVAGDVPVYDGNEEPNVYYELVWYNKKYKNKGGIRMICLYIIEKLKIIKMN